MALTRERKLLLTVLALGAAALLIDRVVLNSGQSGPQSASASATAVSRGDERGDQESTVSAAKAALAKLEAQDTGPTLSERLADTASQHAVTAARPGDAFAPPKQWLRAIAPKPKPAEPAPEQNAQPAQPDAQRLVKRFREAHRLMAVMANRGEGVAIVDGQPVRVGDRLDGFTLRQVRERTAVFVSGETRVVLEVAAGR